MAKLMAKYPFVFMFHRIIFVLFDLKLIYAQYRCVGTVDFNRCVQMFYDTL